MGLQQVINMTYNNSKRRNRHGSNKNTFRKNLITVTLIAVGSVGAISIAAIGANVGAIATSANQSAANLSAQITQGITAFSTSTVTSITQATNQTTSAIQVATAQEAASAQAMAESSTKVAQKEATVRNALRMQDLIIKNYKNFSAKSGQGFKACKVVAENKGMDSAQTQTKYLAAGLEAKTLQSITMTADLSTDIYTKYNISANEFCPAGSTYCTPSTTLQGADLNAASLFMPASTDSKEKLARTLYREHLLGVNQQAPQSAAQANSPAGQMALYESNRQAALLSPAAYSLAYIDAQNTKTIVRDGVKYSANELIDQTVSKYYGGAEAKEWQASMLTQEPRGLLVEAARLGGLTVWLNNEIYQQSLRKEANLAAILIATAQPISKNVLDQGQKLQARGITNIASVYK